LLIAAITVGLYFLDGYLQFYTWVPGSGFIRRSWLPILFLLFYAMLMVAWWLYVLLVKEEMPGDFPDIDAAWAAALEGLQQHGLKLDDLPLFFILGQPEGGSESLVRASGLNIRMPQTPAGDPPVSLFATEEALYVLCPGASVLGTLARLLCSPISREAGGTAEDAAALEATLRPGQGGDGQSLEMQAVFARAPGGDIRKLPASDRRELRRLERLASPSRPTSRQADVLDLQTARLRHFCRLLVRDRKPYCAANGMLVLVPFAGLDSPQDASDVADACKRDMEAARSALEVHCPVFAAVCDMESAPGFTDFVASFRPEERRRRIGQRTALIPQLRGGTESVQAMMRSLADWICLGFLRSSIVQRFRLEGGNLTLAEAVGSNARLFELLCDMHHKRAHLEVVLAEGFTSYAPPEKLLFGGCYLAATGTTDAPNQQAFMAGIFGRLQEGVATVYWTDEVRDQEARLNALIGTGWVVLGALAVGALGLIYYVWATYRRGGG
jgi:hypothetical protein